MSFKVEQIEDQSQVAYQLNLEMLKALERLEALLTQIRDK